MKNFKMLLCAATAVLSMQQTVMGTGWNKEVKEAIGTVMLNECCADVGWPYTSTTDFVRHFREVGNVANDNHSNLSNVVDEAFRGREDFTKPLEILLNSIEPRVNIASMNKETVKLNLIHALLDGINDKRINGLANDKKNRPIGQILNDIPDEVAGFVKEGFSIQKPILRADVVKKVRDSRLGVNSTVGEVLNYFRNYNCGTVLDYAVCAVAIKYVVNNA